MKFHHNSKNWVFRILNWHILSKASARLNDAESDQNTVCAEKPWFFNTVLPRKGSLIEDFADIVGNMKAS